MFESKLFPPTLAFHKNATSDLPTASVTGASQGDPVTYLSDPRSALAAVALLRCSSQMLLREFALGFLVLCEGHQRHQRAHTITSPARCGRNLPPRLRSILDPRYHRIPREHLFAGSSGYCMPSAIDALSCSGTQSLLLGSSTTKPIFNYISTLLPPFLALLLAFPAGPPVSHVA